MMLLHIPSGGGKPTLVSLPRDSYVPIPDHGRNKLNASFAFGGPQLLVETGEKTVNGTMGVEPEPVTRDRVRAATNGKRIPVPSHRNDMKGPVSSRSRPGEVPVKN